MGFVSAVAALISSNSRPIKARNSRYRFRSSEPPSANIALRQGLSMEKGELARKSVHETKIFSTPPAYGSVIAIVLL
jgi:hypothetical protein